MISIILPYWQRQLAATRALARLALCYSRHSGKTAVEVVVVDDGSPEPFQLPGALGNLSVRILTLPAKARALNPCVPINRGVAAARGEVIVLSNSEILHRGPILAEMFHKLYALGPLGYVSAACWCPDQKAWHAHSSVLRRDLFQPRGSAFHFCSMLRRELWEKAGGFDERYRDGQAYDDADWILRAARAGANFHIDEDLVVEHPWRSTKSSWGPGMLERNRRLFFETWGEPARRAASC